MLLGCSSQEERRAHHEERARAYLAEQKYAEAKIELLNWVQLAPQDAQVHLELAEVYGRLGEYRDALVQYREAVEAAPERNDWRIRLAALELASGRPDAARDQAEQVLASDPANAQALIVRGGARGQRGDPDGQLADLREAREHAPRDVSVLVALAQLLSRREDDAEAEQLLRRVLEIDPSPGSRFLLANFLIDRGRLDEGRAILQQALAVASAPAERLAAQLSLSDLEVRSGDPAAAERTLREALAASPDEVELLLRLARLYLLRGEEQRAGPLLEAYVARRPREIQPLLTLASFHQSRGDVADALAAVDRARAIDPESEEARLLRAEYLMELRSQNNAYEPEARELLRGVLAENPGSAHAQFVSAKFHFADGELDAAAEELSRVLRGAPSAAVYLLRARAYNGLGQPERAREDLGEALRIDPSNQTTRRELAALEIAGDDASQALDVLEPLLKLNPRDGPSLLLRAEGLHALGRTKEAVGLLTRADFTQPRARTQEVLRAAELYRRMGSLDRARGLLRGVLARTPQDADAVELAVSLELQARQPAQARAALDRALQAAPNSARLLALRGSFAVQLAQQGQLVGADSAESDLRQAIALEPRSADAHLALARLERLRGRPEDALAAYVAAVEREPHQTDRILELGAYLESLGRPDAARERYEQALALDPRSPWAKNNLAWALAAIEPADDKVLQRAQTLGQEAVDARPTEAAFKDTLGYVLLRRERTLAAAAVFREAIDAFSRPSPERSLARYHLALALERSGELERARDEVESALSEAPAFPARDEASALRDRLPRRPARR